MRLDSQRLAEKRSLALHRRVAELLREDPELLSKVRKRVASWLAGGHPSAAYLRRWEELLALPLADLTAVLEEDSEVARELRGASPFAGIVDPRERWRIWALAREAWEAGRP